MSALQFAGLAVLVTAAMAAVDFAHARYALAMVDVREGPAELVGAARHRAARWSTVQWASAAVALYLSVRVSMLLLPFEGVGLYLGTWLGGKRRRPSGDSRS